MEMIEKNGDTASPECSRYQDILERMVAQLGVMPEEQEFARTHRAACPECALNAKVLDVLAEIPAVLPAEGLATKLEVLSRFEGGRARTRRLTLSLAAAAAAAVVLCLLWLPETEPENLVVALVSGTATRSNGQTIGNTPLLAVEGEAILSGEKGAVIDAGEFTRIHLVPKSRVALAEVRKKRETIRLDDGAIAVVVRPQLGSQLEIQTRDCLVVVKGTTFFVELQEGGTQVDVLDGIVQVHLPARQRSVDLAAGESFLVETGQKTTLPGDRRGKILSVLGATEPIPAPEREPDRGREEPFQDTCSPRGIDGGLGQIKETEPGHHDGRRPGKRYSSLTRSPVSAGERPTVEELIREARDCRTRQEWSCAANAYARLLELHPKSPEAITERVPLAEIEIEHLGRPQKALRHFREYLNKRPTGSLAREALHGTINALKELGRVEEEKAALEQFLASFPNSPFSSRLRVRLQEIKQTAGTGTATDN